MAPGVVVTAAVVVQLLALSQGDVYVMLTYCFPPCRRPLLESHHLILGVWTAVLFTAAVTNIIKCPVGRLRPDFNARWVLTQQYQ
jgi:hypothetical protein